MSLDIVTTADLDQLKSTYKAALEEWVAAIRAEEVLVFSTDTLEAIDQWEGAHFKEEECRDKAKDLKAQYEDALRKQQFNF
jgi:hypothetical protein